MQHEEIFNQFVKKLSVSVAEVILQYGQGKITDDQFETFWNQVGMTAMQVKHETDDLEKIEATRALGIDLSTFFEDNPNN